MADCVAEVSGALSVGPLLVRAQLELAEAKASFGVPGQGVSASAEHRSPLSKKQKTAWDASSASAGAPSFVGTSSAVSVSGLSSTSAETMSSSRPPLRIPPGTPLPVAAPAAPAIGQCRFKDVRGSQEEQDRAELERIKKHLISAPAESSRRTRRDDMSRPNATAESSAWPRDAPWKQPGYVHPKDCSVFDPPFGETFSPSVHTNQRVAIQPHVRRDYEGRHYDKGRMDSCSHAIIKCIRHSWLLPRGPTGWCFVTDVAFIMWRDFTQYYYVWENDRPSDAELLLAMELNLNKSRFQVSALSDQKKPHNVMVRAVQGYSGVAGDQIDDDRAYARITEVAGLFHYTKRKYLDTIIGWHGRGLVAGGLLNNNTRTHIYCVTKPPPHDSWLHDPDRRHGTNIVIQLDHVAIAADNVMFGTAKGAVLIKNTVPLRHIVKVTLLGCPKYMLWRQPQVLVPKQRCARCQLCKAEYQNGTLWCYDGCWMPLTWLAVQERVQHIAKKEDRLSELRSCYGLNFRGLSEMQRTAGASTRNLPLDTFSAHYQRRHCEYFTLAPPGRSESEKGDAYMRTMRRQGRDLPQGSPALAAVRVPESSGPSNLGSTGQRAASSSASAGTVAYDGPRVVPRGSVAAVATAAAPAVSNDPPLEGFGSESRFHRLMLMLRMGGISYNKIYSLNKDAKRHANAAGVRYLSHTDRWIHDAHYREAKIRDNCPKWLVYKSGDTHRLDGQPGDEFPEDNRQ